MANVKVVLRDDVDHLGKRGDTVAVKPGYARNHLFPRNLALPHSEDNLRRVGREQEKFIQAEMQRIEELKAMKDRLEAIEIVIPAKASEEGHLFGSVTEKAILDALAAAGFTVEPRAVKLDTHLKEVGDRIVPLMLHSEVVANLKVRVVREGGDAASA